MTKRAIIAVDLQNEYWPNGGLPLENIEGAAANAARVIAHARKAGDLVVNVRHEMPVGRSSFPDPTRLRLLRSSPPLRVSRSSPRTTPTPSARLALMACSKRRGSRKWWLSAP